MTHLISDNCIDVWRIAWREVLSEYDACQLLTAQEYARADLYKLEDDRRRFKAGRMALRYLAGRYLNVDPLELAMEASARGKPYWRDYGDRLSFNVSHSGDWVFIAFSPGFEVGIDVQLVDSGSRFRGARIAKYALHPDERRAIEVVPEPEKRSIFYSIWTAKEAVIKAAGLGLHGSLGKFSVLPGLQGGIWQCAAVETGEVLFRAVTVDASHRGALAVKNSDKSLELNMLQFNFFNHD